MSERCNCGHCCDAFAELVMKFVEPPREYSIYPIRHGLCNLLKTQGRLRAEIDWLKKCGFHGVVTNPGWGEDYLRSWQPLKKVVAELEKEEFQILLYDEKGYPSGSAGGRVLEAHPELETVGMMSYRFPRLLRGPTRYRADVPDGRIYRVYLLPAETDLENTAVGLKGRIDVTRSVDRRGTLWVTVPKGRWVLLMLFIRTQYDDTHSMLSYSEPRRYINLLDRKAGEAFVRVTHEQFYRAVGRSFGKSIRAIFTDEPSLQPSLDHKWPYGVLPWHDSLPAAFRKKFGRDIEEALLAAAVSNVGPMSASLRCDFWEVVSEQCANGYFAPIEEWCAKHRVAATGHLLIEEGISRHPQFEGSYFHAMRRFQMPGIDVLNSRPESVMKQSVTPKLASSVAHLTGRAEVMSEASDHTEWTQRLKPVTIGEIKASMNWHHALGANVITSYYDFSRFSERQLRDLNLYVRRLGAVLRSGEHTAPVAVFYPAESLWAGTIRGMTAGEAQDIEKKVLETVDTLLGMQADFDFVDEAELAKSRFSVGKLEMSGRTYSLLVLPAATTIDLKLLGAISGFARRGGRVVVVEPAPFRLRGKPEGSTVDPRLRRLAGMRNVTVVKDAGEGLRRAVSSADVADVVVDVRCPGLLVHHRRMHETDIYFLANMGRKPYKGRAMFKGAGVCVELDLSSGKPAGAQQPARAGDRLAVKVEIPALGGRFYIFEPSMALRLRKSRGKT